MQLSALTTSLRRALRWHRRLFAALFAALAVYCVLAVATGGEDAVVVIAAARPIPGGAVLQPGDLSSMRLPAAAVPEGALTTFDAAVGQTVVAPLPPRGVLTTSSLTSSDDLVAPGRLALPVPLDVNAPLGLLHVGDRIDLLGVGGSGAVEVLARAVRVVVIPSAEPGGLLGSTTRVVVVDVGADDAARVMAAAVGSPLGFALH